MFGKYFVEWSKILPPPTSGHVGDMKHIFQLPSRELQNQYSTSGRYGWTRNNIPYTRSSASQAGRPTIIGTIACVDNSMNTDILVQESLASLVYLNITRRIEPRRDSGVLVLSMADTVFEWWVLKFEHQSDFETRPWERSRKISVRASTWTVGELTEDATPGKFTERLANDFSILLWAGGGLLFHHFVWQTSITTTEN